MSWQPNNIGTYTLMHAFYCLAKHEDNSVHFFIIITLQVETRWVYLLNHRRCCILRSRQQRGPEVLPSARACAWPAWRRACACRYSTDHRSPQRRSFPIPTHAVLQIIRDVTAVYASQSENTSPCCLGTHSDSKNIFEVMSARCSAAHRHSPCLTTSGSWPYIWYMSPTFWTSGFIDILLDFSRNIFVIILHWYIAESIKQCRFADELHIILLDVRFSRLYVQAWASLYIWRTDWEGSERLVLRKR